MARPKKSKGPRKSKKQKMAEKLPEQAPAPIETVVATAAEGRQEPEVLETPVESPSPDGLTAEIEIVPISGSRTSRTVSFAPGTTVGKILEQTGISFYRKDILVNGSPVKQSDVVSGGGQVKIEVMERPSGS